MNFLELKTALCIENGVIKNNQITVSTNTLTSNINKLLEYCYDNQPIVIDNASLKSEDLGNNLLIIEGKTNFLNIPRLNIEAHFSIDHNNQAQVFLKYHLLDSIPTPNAWNFSRSFSELPKVLDNNQPIYFDYQAKQSTEFPLIVPLDALYLFDSYYVVVSNPQKEPDFQINLKWGINFVSHLRPQGFLGIIENLFQYKNQLTIYGTIRKPLPTENPDNLASHYPGSLERFLYPWNIEGDFPDGLPGILLQVDLDIDYSVINDKIRFKGEKLYFYTPLTNVWLLPDTNPKFIPLQAYTGSIEIVGTGIKLDMVSPIQIGVDEFELIGFFQGVSLSNLSQLVGLTGSEDSPLALLPGEFIGKELGKLELINTYLSFDYSFIEDIEITSVSFTVGMPELKWQIWDSHFEIDSIYCTFNIDYPLSTIADSDFLIAREVNVTVYGNLKIEEVPFTVYAHKGEDFTVYAEMGEAQTIPLQRIMEVYASGVPAPSDLTINVFRVEIAPRQYYAMALALAQEPNPWIIPVGPKGFKVEDVFVGLVYPSGGPISGSIGGTIWFGDFAKVSILYDIPGNIIIRALLPEVTLRQIVDTLTDQLLRIPDAFDLKFTNSSILMQKQEANYIFQLATQIEQVGLVALQVQRINTNTDTNWGVAFGFDISVKPSSLPGLSFLASFETIFSMTKFLMVVSSFETPSFQFPDTANFQNPRINAKKITLPAQADKLVAGLNVYAEWTLDTANQQQNLLKEFLGLDPTLGITLQVGIDPAKNSKLYVSYTTQIENYPLICKFGGQIKDGSIALFLTGTMTINIQGQPQTFDLTLLFVENGAFLAADVKGPTAIDFEVFKLSNLALEIGIDWEGIPSLGVAATIDVENLFESSVAVFFDSAEPSKSMVAGSLSDLSLKNVLDYLAGNTNPSSIDEVLKMVSVKGTHSFDIPVTLADDLDNLKLDQVAPAFQAKGVTIPSDLKQTLLVRNEKNQPSSKWYLTDLTTMKHYELVKNDSKITVSLEAQLYVAPQATSIGTILFPQGFLINGKLEFFLFNLEATININPNQGIAIDAQMDKIVIGNEHLFSLKALEGDGGPNLSVATYTQPDQKVEELKSPHFYINGQLEMLGISRGAFVSLTENGFEFYLNGDLVLAVHGEIHGHFKGLRDMAAGGSLDIKVGTIDLGRLGKIPINTGVQGKLDIKVDQDSISVTFDANFEFAGETYKIAKFDLEISAKTLENLVSTLAKKIKDALLEILKDAEKWLESVEKGFIEGVEDIAAVLAEKFGLIYHAIWGHPEQEITVLRELLTKSQAATIEVTQGTPAPSQAIIDEVTAWAKQMQERAILNYVAAADQAKANRPDDATKYVMGYVNSFAVTYEESQVVDWIFNAKQNLPPLTDFNTKYYRKVSQERLFNVLVKTDVDFNTIVNDLTVTINYPNLSPSSFRFTSSDQQHLFTTAWDATQAAEYELQYTVTFKDGSPAFTSPPVNQVDTNIILSPAKIGIQSVLFDASTIDFGTGEGKVDRVDITVKFSGDADTPTKVVSLSANQKVATVKSTYRVPVANVYTYTATYYQNKQIVYTTPEIPNTNVTQAIYNPLIARDVEFQGAGFESGLQMINLTVGTRSIQLTPQQPNQTIPYVFTPGPHMITYRGTMATSQGPVPIPETTRPASSIITVGVNVPQWFSVQINSSSIQWADISAIIVELSKGTLSSHGDSVYKTILSDSDSSYWGFDYTNTDGSPHYCWAVTYYYKNGNKKTTKLIEAGSTILNLPQNPD